MVYNFEHWVYVELVRAGMGCRGDFVAAPLQSRFGKTKAIPNRDREEAAMYAERND